MPESLEKYQEMRRLLQSLEESDKVIVTAEKTNNFRSTRKEKYKTMTEEYLRQSEKYIEFIDFS